MPIVNAAVEPKKSGKELTPLETLQEQYNDLRGDGSEQGEKLRAKLGGQLKRLSHEAIHPGEDWVELDVPQAVDGSFFGINEQQYIGVCVVPACVAQQLLYMIDQNRAVDLQRMKESGRTVVLGNLADRARLIQDNR